MRTIRMTILGAAVTAAGLTAGTPAQALTPTRLGAAAVSGAAATETSAAYCKQIRLYRPEMRKGHVAATVWGRGCARSQRINIKLQRKRAWGWQEIATGTLYGPGPKTLYKGCKRGTTFTYRLWGSLVDPKSKYPKIGWSPATRARCR